MNIKFTLSLLILSTSFSSSYLFAASESKGGDDSMGGPSASASVDAATPASQGLDSLLTSGFARPTSISFAEGEMNFFDFLGIPVPEKEMGYGGRYRTGGDLCENSKEINNIHTCIFRYELPSLPKGFYVEVSKLVTPTDKLYSKARIVSNIVELLSSIALERASITLIAQKIVARLLALKTPGMNAEELARIKLHGIYWMSDASWAQFIDVAKAIPFSLNGKARVNALNAIFNIQENERPTTFASIALAHVKLQPFLTDANSDNFFASLIKTSKALQVYDASEREELLDQLITLIDPKVDVGQQISGCLDALRNKTIKIDYSDSWPHRTEEKVLTTREDRAFMLERIKIFKGFNAHEEFYTTDSVIEAISNMVAEIALERLDGIMGFVNILIKPGEKLDISYISYIMVALMRIQPDDLPTLHAIIKPIIDSETSVDGLNVLLGRHDIIYSFVNICRGNWVAFGGCISALGLTGNNHEIIEILSLYDPAAR